MTSKSRIAQQALTELEKTSAAYEDQLIEAAKFIGTDYDALSSLNVQEPEKKKRRQSSAGHGKEEWLLKWLLKKLQAPKDETPRRSPVSWQLLLCVLQKLPLPSAAKVLAERKFVAILQQTLEEAKQRPVEVAEIIGSTTNGDVESAKKSKKRKRSSQAHESFGSQKNGVQSLLTSILQVVEFIAQSTTATSGTDSEGRGSEFAAEYMRTVLRVSAEAGAKLLGSWLLLLKKHNAVSQAAQLLWLSPFIEIWHLHTLDENRLTHFSLHCTLPLLSLREVLPKAGPMRAELELLVSRNIITPSKAAKVANDESTLFADLTKLAVISDSSNASYFLEVAIRSIQPQSSKRRRPADETWLKSVFKSLSETLPRKRVEQNGKAICAMIQSAIVHKVDLELDALRSITSEFALPEDGQAHWELLHLILKLDSNVFLIPNEEKDLLQVLLDKINKTSTSSGWEEVATEVIEDVIVPLIAAFAKARDLTGFIHHWYTQLVKIHTAAAKSSAKSSKQSAWEDSRLQLAVQQSLEASLSSQQVTQLLEWLQERAAEQLGAVSVIVQAISGAISQEEYIDAVGSKCYQVVIGSNTSSGAREKYQWRIWRILSNTLAFVTPAVREQLAGTWEQGGSPFNTLSTDVEALKFSKVLDSSPASSALELWRLGCVSWSVAKAGSTLQKMAKPLIVQLNKKLINSIKDAKKALAKHPGDGIVSLTCTMQMLNEHPRVLLVAKDLEGDSLKSFLKTIFTIASESSGSPATPQSLLARSWNASLHHDIVLNDSELTEIMIDIMLDAVTEGQDVSSASSELNLTITSLLQLPMVVVHRKHRERVMKSWIPSAKSDDVLNSAMLALKIKMMSFPMFYEGMTFANLVDTAAAVKNSSTEDLLVHIGLFKQLATLTIDFVLHNIDQPRNQTYIKDVLAFLSKQAKKAAETDGNELNIGFVPLLGVVAKSLHSNSEALVAAGLLKEKDLKKAESRIEATFLVRFQAVLPTVLGDSAGRVESLLAITLLETLRMLDISETTVAELQKDAIVIREGHMNGKSAVQDSLDTLLASSAAGVGVRLNSGNCLSILGRRAIHEQAAVFLSTSSTAEKMSLLKTSLSGNSDDVAELAQILAIRRVLLSSEDIRRNKKKVDSDSDTDSSDDDKPDQFDLSAAYSLLCNHLPRAQGVRQFAIVSETMATLLRTKARSMTQWNIDSTLGAITTICSRNGPALRTLRASTIFLHLCHLFQAVLLSHRLKLEGHFHLVVQALQSLLRCLFVPLPHSSTKILKTYVPPPWLSVTPMTYLLTPAHAEAFTRLVTLICDPSVSSVTHRVKHNALSSATDKAKRMAGQHMVFVLMSYVKLQLDMKMLPGMREKMTPGLYAVFDTTTPESRRAVSEALDSSGRAVFGVLYRDYLKFGKWKGS